MFFFVKWFIWREIKGTKKSFQILFYVIIFTLIICNHVFRVSLHVNQIFNYLIWRWGFWTSRSNIFWLTNLIIFIIVLIVWNWVFYSWLFFFTSRRFQRSWLFWRWNKWLWFDFRKIRSLCSSNLSLRIFLLFLFFLKHIFFWYVIIRLNSIRRKNRQSLVSYIIVQLIGLILFVCNWYNIFWILRDVHYFQWFLIYVNWLLFFSSFLNLIWNFFEVSCLKLFFSILRNFWVFI